MSDDHGIQDEPPPRRTGRGRREDDDYPEDLPAGGAPFPTSVAAAGVIWIVIGSLILLNGAANLVVSTAAAPAAGGSGAYAAGSVCGVLFIVLFGAAFLFVGVQSVRGTARDTLGNAIGSLVFALLYGGIGVVALVGGAVVGGAAGTIAMIGAFIAILGGIALLSAGVLALVGRDAYKAWQRAQRKGRRRDDY
jgi:hypothetical protein